MGKKLFKRALEQWCMANCFACADAVLYGDDFALNSIKEAEANLREVAGRLIAGDY